MDAERRKRTPHQHHDGWWYEERGGISVYCERPDHINNLVVIIPWRALKGAMKRAGVLK